VSHIINCSTLLKYSIRRQISTGSFGIVYEILNEEDNKIYALKELTNIDTVSKQRFEREVKINQN
jgi:serine/threonine protein kinase